MTNKILTRQKESAVDTTKATAIEFRVGPDARGPRRCLHCGQDFKPGETWKRVTSAVDPELGAYSFGIHDACDQSPLARAA
jgi:hypothetical protein